MTADFVMPEIAHQELAGIVHIGRDEVKDFLFLAPRNEDGGIATHILNFDTRWR
jgi:hypothetical protein